MRTKIDNDSVQQIKANSEVGCLMGAREGREGEMVDKWRCFNGGTDQYLQAREVKVRNSRKAPWAGFPQTQRPPS
jgi:hypothetical protein